MYTLERNLTGTRFNFQQPFIIMMNVEYNTKMYKKKHKQQLLLTKLIFIFPNSKVTAKSLTSKSYLLYKQFQNNRISILTTYS